MARLAVLNLYNPSPVFVPVSGGAPSGLALCKDEDTLFVFCRTTYDVVRFDLTTRKSTRLRLAKDPLPLAGAFGRRLFADSNAMWLSGGLGCAACHPEGRDDGYTWRETEGRFIGLRENGRARTYDGSSVCPPGAGYPGFKLYARQTPMLAGRVRASGPYGWHGESKDLRARLIEGTKLHRSLVSDARTDSEITTTDAVMIAAYRRAGLLPPPTRDRPLTDQEAAGKRIFEGSTASCAHCHHGTELTNRSIADLPAFHIARDVNQKALPSTPDFDAEPDTHFKTPSLWFVGGTAPYFHDGSARSRA